MRVPHSLLGALVLAGAFFAAVPARAQTAPPPPLRVFLDCGPCDEEFLRQTIVFIDYVRDRTDADLHVLVTTQGTGQRRHRVDDQVHRPRPVPGR